MTAKTAFAPTDEEAMGLYNKLTEYMFENGPDVVFALVYKHIPMRERVRRLQIQLPYLHTVFDTVSKQRVT